MRSNHTSNPCDSSRVDVAIVMGSDSDWPVMKAAADILDEFDISYHAKVVSAHRMPHDMVTFGKEARDRGYRVIIAGAGGAAHLPGMLAATTTLPVIGVPVGLRRLDGLDSLLSIVQMPAGVPVATVSIDGAKNAGLLAARMLSISEDESGLSLEAKMIDYQQSLRKAAIDKGATLETMEEK